MLAVICLINFNCFLLLMNAAKKGQGIYALPSDGCVTNADNRGVVWIRMFLPTAWSVRHNAVSSDGKPARLP